MGERLPKSELNTDTIDHVIAISDPGDRMMINIGNIAAWLFPILMIAIVSQVFLRKAGMNQAWLDDAQWWLYGFAMITGFGYAITTDSHVRVDIFHENFPEAKKARIEVFALGWLLLPFLAMMSDILMHYAYASWQVKEGSDSPNGLHGLFMLKMSMPVLLWAAIIAAFAVLHRNLAKITKPVLWKTMIATFPTLWFTADRGVHYIFWWFTRFTNPELNPRRISKEPIMDNVLWYGLALLLIIAAASYAQSRRSSSKA